jgi:predicted transcriptional regulator
LEEYIRPLAEVGLLQEDHNPFELTVFGSKVTEMVKSFPDLEEILPPHSECYEERAMESMLSGPKTYEEIRRIIPRKSAARVLSRLQKAGLVESNNDKNYVFFFQTKRSPFLENLSPTENRVYENIRDQGIYAKKLANDSGISLRRTYKYLRKLKGKKLIFERKKPLAYGLTDQGSRVGSMLKSLRNLTIETKATSERFLKEKEVDSLKKSG